VSDIAIEPGAHGVALSGAPLPLFDVPVSQPWGPSPLRRPGSVRRTMTLDATWPDGQDGDVIFAGDARDIVTEWQGGGPVPKPAIVATAHIDVVAEHRVMLSVTSTPPRPELAQLSGARAGGYLRAEIDKALPGEKRGGTPLYLLLALDPGLDVAPFGAGTSRPCGAHGRHLHRLPAGFGRPVHRRQARAGPECLARSIAGQP
jgi:hypothetical protein